MNSTCSLLIISICFLGNNLISAQRQAQFEINFFFEDAQGRKDTLFFRADSSIIDDQTTSSDDLNLDWDEFVDNSPFDSILSVRAKPLSVIGGNFYKNIILQAYDNGQGCIAPKPVVIFVYTSSWPIKMTWNQDYFRIHSCLFGTFATPDAEYARKWLFNNPVPIREIACLGNQSYFVKDLRESELFANWELPYETIHEVSGKGKIPITAIQIYFGRPWAHLCDTTTSVNELSSFKVSIYPIIVTDQLHIMNFNLEVINCQIYNMEGELINNFNLLSNENSINLESLNPGLYIVIINNLQGKKFIKKIIKS